MRPTLFDFIAQDLAGRSSMPTLVPFNFFNVSLRIEITFFIPMFRTAS